MRSSNKTRHNITEAVIIWPSVTLWIVIEYFCIVLLLLKWFEYFVQNWRAQTNFCLERPTDFFIFDPTTLLHFVVS